MVPLPAPEVRFATLDDLDWCVQYVERLDDPERCRRSIENDEILLAEVEDVVIGYIRWEFLWLAQPLLDDIRVQSEHRGQGVGRAMLRFLAAHLRSDGYDSLVSSSGTDRPRAQQWHRAMGFYECGILTGFNDGIGELFFRLDLSRDLPETSSRRDADPEDEESDLLD